MSSRDVVATSCEKAKGLAAQNAPKPKPATSLLGGAWQRLAADSPPSPGGQPSGSGSLHSFSNVSLFPPGQGPEVLNRSMRSSGSPLPHLGRLQQSFGPFDLSSLRVHSGSEARDAADSISAQAFTHGEHIVAPESMSLRIVAHEAAHAIQQRQPGLVPPGISTPSDAGERHADAVAERAVQGRSAADLLARVAPRGMRASMGAPPRAFQRLMRSKTSTARIDESITFLDNFVTTPEHEHLQKIWAQVKTSLQSWQGRQDNELDRERIGRALHLGSAGNAAARSLRRAIILLRTALLRHESGKAHREVVALPVSALGTTVSQLLQVSANHAPLIPNRFQAQALFDSWNNADNLHGKEAGRAQTRRRQLIKEYKDILGVQYLSEEQQIELDAYVDELTVSDQQGVETLKNQADQEKISFEKFQHQHAQRARLIFQPSQDTDDNIDNNLKFLGFPIIKAGEEGLASLGAGGDLYIVGHGNFGVGVGTHDDFMDAPALFSALEAAGLPRNPQKPVELYIWACWGAVHTQIQGPRTRPARRTYRMPYAQRLASQLAEHHYGNYNVIGFAGSVNEGSVYQKVVENHGNEEDSESVVPSLHHSIYSVKDGDYNRTVGEDWSATVTTPSQGVEVYQVQRRPATD